MTYYQPRPWVGNPFPTPQLSTQTVGGKSFQTVGGKSFSHPSAINPDPWAGNPFPTARGWEILFPPFGYQPRPWAGNPSRPWVGNPFPTPRLSTPDRGREILPDRGWEILFPRPVGGKSFSHPSAINPDRGWEILFPPRYVMMIFQTGSKSFLLSN